MQKNITTVTGTFRMQATHLAGAAVWLTQNGYTPHSRNDIVASALEVLFHALSEDQRPVDVSQAFVFLDREYPHASYKGGRRLRGIAANLAPKPASSYDNYCQAMLSLGVEPKTEEEWKASLDN